MHIMNLPSAVVNAIIMHVRPLYPFMAEMKDYLRVLHEIRESYDTAMPGILHASRYYLIQKRDEIFRKMRIEWIYSRRVVHADVFVAYGRLSRYGRTQSPRKMSCDMLRAIELHESRMLFKSVRKGFRGQRDLNEMFHNITSCYKMWNREGYHEDWYFVYYMFNY